jgi:alpha-tubulin suppressor-like RCC1 family protein
MAMEFTQLARKKNMRARNGIILLIGLVLVGCGGGGGGGGGTTPPPVGSGSDTTPPAVLSTNPPNTAVGSSLTALQVTFSEPVDPNSVSVGSFVVTGPSGPVNGAVSVNGAVATFTPSAALPFGTDFQARLTTAIRDSAGNQLSADYAWRFNTGKQLALSMDDGNHTCARLVDGRVKCWGINVYGQLGVGDTTTRGDGPNEMGANLPAVDLGSGRTAVQIVTGRDHVCARLDNLRVKCWGKGSVLGLAGGNRGDAPNEMGDNLPAVDLGTGRIALELVAGGEHNCARLDNGRVKCWGNGIALGLGDSNFRGDNPGEMGDALPTLNLGVNRTAVALYAGWSHTCAKLDNAEVKCWGYNGSGQLGTGDTNVYGITPQTVPANVPALDLGGGRTVVKMALGGQHSCALLDNGLVKCWGENGWGQLGLGDTTIRGDGPGEMGDNLPIVNLGSGRTVVDIATGYSHNCVLLDNGDLKCWGFQGATGQLGYGATYPGNGVGDGPGEMGDVLIAVNVGSNMKAREVIGGMSHTCARLDNGQIKCWGMNGSGQLGLGDTVTRGDQIAEMGDNLPAVDLGQ